MEKPSSKTFDNALRLLGEAFVPGASLLMKGEIVSGSAHLIVGAWAKAAIGPVGHALVIANSYTEASTGQSLLKHFSKVAEGLRSEAPADKSAEPGSKDNPEPKPEAEPEKDA